MSQEPKMFLFDLGGRIYKKDVIAGRVRTMVVESEELGFFDFLPGVGGKKKKKDVHPIGPGHPAPSQEPEHPRGPGHTSSSSFKEVDHPRDPDGSLLRQKRQLRRRRMLLIRKLKL